MLRDNFLCSCCVRFISLSGRGEAALLASSQPTAFREAHCDPVIKTNGFARRQIPDLLWSVANRFRLGVLLASTRFDFSSIPGRGIRLEARVSTTTTTRFQEAVA